MLHPIESRLPAVSYTHLDVYKRQNQITGKQIYDILVHFEMMYYKMTDLEKKEFMKDFINSIELYPEKMDNGSIVKQINFKFGVYYEGHETMDIRLLNEKTVETVVGLQRKDT